MRELDASAAVLAVLLFTACAVPGVGQASTSDLINGAGSELAHATGLQVNGAFSKDSGDFSVDIQMNPPHSAHITASKSSSSQTSLNYEAIQIGDKDYYRSLDLARVAAAQTPDAQQVARMVGGHWFTYRGTPLDLGVFASAADIKANFLTDLKVDILMDRFLEPLRLYAQGVFSYRQASKRVVARGVGCHSQFYVCRFVPRLHRRSRAGL